ncbi:MAG: diaminopimelate epimerase [Planctomycetota bacterium]
MTTRTPSDALLLDAIGNRFVAVAKTPADPRDAARAMCEAHDADGLLAVTVPERAHAIDVGLWNRDGSDGEMSGNGARCASLFAQRALGVEPDVHDEIDVRMPAGSVRVRGRVASDEPRLAVTLGPVTLGRESRDEHGQRTFEAHTGNPHLIMLVPSVRALQETDVESLGAHAQRGFQQSGGVNAHWVAIESRTCVRLRTFERGVGVTPSCGSGSAAAFATLRAHGLIDAQCRVVQAGGALDVRASRRGFVEIESPVRIVTR